MFGSLIRYLRVEEITDVQSKPALDCVADRFHTIGTRTILRPRSTECYDLQELRERRLVHIAIPQLRLPLRSMMVFRRDSASETAGQLIEIMRNKLFVPRLHPDRMEAAN